MTLWTPAVYSELRKAGLTLEPWAARRADEWDREHPGTGPCVVCGQAAAKCRCAFDHATAGGI